MDAYKPPEAELFDESNRPFKPIKGILIGLAYTVIFTTLVSIAWSILFAVMAGIDFAAADFESMLSRSPGFMVPDLILSSIVVYLGGRAVGKRVPTKELKFGFIVALITIAILIPVFVMAEAIQAYPVWYNILSFLIMIVAIPYGAKSISKS